MGCTASCTGWVALHGLHWMGCIACVAMHGFHCTSCTACVAKNGLHYMLGLPGLHNDNDNE